jgi:hypothetical protein
MGSKFPANEPLPDNLHSNHIKRESKIGSRNTNKALGIDSRYNDFLN